MDDDNDTTDALRTLTDEECWDRLSHDQLGRLVTHVGDLLDIFPVNYVVDEGTIVFRTGEGSKLFELTVNDEVLFEVDGHTDETAWSVVVRGHAQRLDTSDDVAAADRLPLRPWLPTLKYNYVRIRPTAVSGRTFRRGVEPERYGVADY